MAYTPTEWESKFLELYRSTGNITLSARAVGIDRTTVYKRRENYKTFADLMDSAREEAIDRLEAEARKRALATSDTLLIFLLKALRPEMYRDTYHHELTGKDGSPLAQPTVQIYLPEINRDDLEAD